jgi:ketosteroid isomerase-like protein
MPESERVRVTRETYRAFEARDRTILDAVLSDDFRFFSAAHRGIDREQFFERVWPNVDGLTRYALLRAEEISSDAVLVTYDAVQPDGSTYRGTEIFSFTGSRMSRAEAYSGWTTPAEGSPRESA